MPIDLLASPTPTTPEAPPQPPPQAAPAATGGPIDLLGSPEPKTPQTQPSERPLPLDVFKNPMDTAGPGPDPFERALIGRTATNPGKIAFGALNTAGQYMDVPLAAAEAAGADALGGNGKHLKQVWYDLTHAPHSGGGAANVAENDVYFRQHSLLRVLSDPQASHEQKAAAQYFLDHPWIAGTADFATEFLNPSNLVGGLVGKGVAAVGKIPKIELAVNEIMNNLGLGNRLAGLRAVELAKGLDRTKLTGLGQQLQDYVKSSEDVGVQKMTPIFEGLGDRNDILEVIHRMQGNKVQAYTDPAKEADIERRAGLLRNEMWNITTQQLKRGTLSISRAYGHDELYPGVFDPIPMRDNRGNIMYTQTNLAGAPRQLTPRLWDMPFTERQEIVDMARGKVYGPPDPDIAPRVELMKKYFDMDKPPPEAKVTYFPMAGSVADVGHTEDQIDFLRSQRGGGGSALGVRKETGGANAPRRKNPTLLDFQNNTELTDPETGEQIENPLRHDWEPAAALYHHLQRRTLNNMISDWADKVMQLGIDEPASTRESGYAALKDTAQRMFGAEQFKGKAFPERFITYLTDLGASRAEVQAWAHSSSLIGKLSGDIGKLYGSSQNLLRQGVVFNPIVHGLWNLGGQYLAAGGSILRLPGIYTRAARDLVAYAKAHSQEFESVIPLGSTEAEQEHAVLHMGAPREFGDEQSIGRAMRPMSTLTLPQKAERFGQRLQTANRTLVFDIIERHMAIDLYNQKLAQFSLRMPKAQAVGAARDFVRRTLGNYGNVSNLGVDKTLNGMFFFYPWLKTLLPFWIKTGLYKPQSWNAPLAGIQTSNELRGDPNARTSEENPYALFLGNTPQGNPQYFDMMLPGRVLEQAGNLVGGVLGQDPEQAKKGFETLLLNRLNPAYKAGAQTVFDTSQGAKQPFGLIGYAPVGARIGHAFTGMENYVPSPLQGMVNIAAAIIQHDRSQLPQAFGQLIGGYGFTGLSGAQRARANKIAGQYHRLIDRELAVGNTDQAWKYYQALQALYLPPKPKESVVTNPQETGVTVPKL